MELRTNQRTALEFIKTRKTVNLFMTPGSGKTTITLHALTELEAFPALIVAPIRVCELVWRQEAKLWPKLENLQFGLIRGTPNRRRIALGIPQDIYLINYELIPWLLDTVVLTRFKALIFDEISNLKDPGSKRFRRLRNTASKVPIRVGLTGTPVGNSLLNLWAEMFLIDSGASLGPRYTDFVNSYFDRPYQYKVVPKPGIKSVLVDKVKYSALYLETYTGGDINYLSIPIELPPQVLKLKKTLLANSLEGIEPKEAMVLVNKVRQLEAGFLYLDNQNAKSVHQEKINGIKQLIESLEGARLIIFYAFRYEQEYLKSLGTSNISEWLLGDDQILYLHPKSAGHGLNLQKNCSHVVFTTLPWSLEHYQQSIARVYRQGQENPVNVYRFTGLACEDYVFSQLNSHNATQLDFMAALKELKAN